MMLNLKNGLLALTLSLSFGSVALAKDAAHPQNHHCMNDGAELTGKTKRECKKEGGTWDKNAASPADKPADAGGKSGAVDPPAAADSK